jgi:hypothetical protein
MRPGRLRLRGSGRGPTSSRAPRGQAKAGLGVEPQAVLQGRQLGLDVGEQAGGGVRDDLALETDRRVALLLRDSQQTLAALLEGGVALDDVVVRQGA